MKITVKRDKSNDVCTIGTLTVNGIFECYTLEDIVRDTKIAGETAIPNGTYRVIITYSPRFKRDLPLLLNVPGYDGVRIHPGNTAEDTHGCLLCGSAVAKDKKSITGSKVATEKLIAKIVAAIKNDEEVWITYL